MKTTSTGLTLKAHLFAAILTALVIAKSAEAAQLKTSGAPATTPVVNVNTASETQLMYLPGVGAQLAGRIVEYVGGVETGKPHPITKAEDLLKVKGIKSAKLAKMRPYIVFSSATTATAKIHAPKETK